METFSPWLRRQHQGLQRGSASHAFLTFRVDLSNENVGHDLAPDFRLNSAVAQFAQV
jgi:hypothetical protein